MLRARAKLYALTRDFFASRQVLEVSPPLVAPHTVTDPHIQSVAVQGHYLQTSPEYAMKKLLAQGSGAIYSLGQVFRAGELGEKHRSEFSMLEWYRPGLSLPELQDEISSLIKLLAEEFETDFPTPNCVSYQTLFQSVFDVNPHQADDLQLKELVREFCPQLGQHIDSNDQGTRNDYLDVLFSQSVEPLLDAPHFVIEFPASQASLAETHTEKGDSQHQTIALRSELYWRGIELSNAYVELRDSSVLRNRMQLDNDIRHSRGLPRIEPDEALLKAIEKMPPCVGVAVGVERLLMVLQGETDISRVCYCL